LLPDNLYEQAVGVETAFKKARQGHSLSLHHITTVKKQAKATQPGPLSPTLEF